jgi:hypothetical protein
MSSPKVGDEVVDRNPHWNWGSSWMVRAGSGTSLVDRWHPMGVRVGTGDDVRLHSAYDLSAGHLVHVEVTDRHSAEGLLHFCFTSMRCSGGRFGPPCGSKSKSGSSF